MPTMISTLAKPDAILSTITPNTITTTPSTMTATVVKKRVAKPSKVATEVPIFLRKTYHMIDTCDPSISSWSEDGETFIVKQPEIFEKQIIPQFFKHSKFSSFVRQLNFYGFRKIKFTDTIKIDAQLEKETRNFWRFKHENFVKGKPELLGEIKRSNSQGSEKKAAAAAVGGKQRNSPGVAGAPSQDVVGLKSEVKTLKSKIENMTANIDKLTSLVEDIKLEKCIKVEDAIEFDDGAAVGTKRKKIEAGSAQAAVAVLPATLPAISTASVSALSLPPLVQPVAQPTASTLTVDAAPSFVPGTPLFPDQITSRSQTVGSTVSDDAFVDELFNAFQDEDMDILPDMGASSIDDSDADIEMRPEPVSSCTLPTSTTDSNLPVVVAVASTAPPPRQLNNAPDPELMAKLSEALAVLPKEIQEMLVNRLISTITSSDALKAHVDQVTQATISTAASEVASANTTTSTTNVERVVNVPLTPVEPNNPEVSLPLAAATLAALISQYSAAIKGKTCEAVGTTTNSKNLPKVIPIHA